MAATLTVALRSAAPRQQQARYMIRNVRSASSFSRSCYFVRQSANHLHQQSSLTSSSVALHNQQLSNGSRRTVPSVFVMAMLTALGCYNFTHSSSGVAESVEPKRSTCWICPIQCGTQIATPPKRIQHSWIRNVQWFSSHDNFGHIVNTNK